MEPKSAMADFACARPYPCATCSHAPPVSTGSVLWAESQQSAAPFFSGCRRADLQPGAAGQNRQRFVRGIARHRGAEPCGMQRAAIEAQQMRAVRVIHKQRHAVFFTCRRDGGHVRDHAVIIGACDIDCGGVRRFCKRILHIPRRNGARQGRTCEAARPDPHGRKAEQRECVDSAAVDVARHHDAAPAPLRHKAQHGLDAQRGAARAHQGFLHAEGGGRRPFRLQDSAGSLKKAVGLRQLGEVEPERAARQRAGRGRTALMPRRVKTRRGLFHIRLRRAKQRRRVKYIFVPHWH